ncbi:cell division protein FtsZ [Vibrio rarus]|uniref:cell division protein FtsZ n=1 Tax=Vibrio rarus TaxID=413403 RepID=UPI0021C32119|nr:cell division protein FtsZ [Vibrio rarus]
MFLPEYIHRIAVVGVGGCGHNTVEHIKNAVERDVDLFVFDTDARGLVSSECVTKKPIGTTITMGRSAGSNPEMGELAMKEALDDIVRSLEQYDIIFICGGLGGGTATGAIPVISEALKASDTITVIITTLPFHFEGKKKQHFSESALKSILQNADAVIPVSNQKLLEHLAKSSTLVEAFDYSNQTLKQSLLGIYSLIKTSGYINLDFADVRTVIKGAGATVIGYGKGSQVSGVEEAVQSTLINPLLDEYDLSKSKAALINISGGSTLRLQDIHDIGELITNNLNSDIPIIIGTAISDNKTEDINIYAIFAGVQPKTLSQPLTIIQGDSHEYH